MKKRIRNFKPREASKQVEKRAETATPDLDGAVAERRIAVRLEPDDAEAHRDLGLTLHIKDDVDGAIAEYRTAIRLEPDYAEAHCLLGHALWEKDDLDGAVAEWRNAVRLRPDDAEPHRDLGFVLSQKGDVDGAIAEYRTAIRLQPEDAMAHYYLGEALEVQGERLMALALDEIQKARELAQLRHEDIVNDFFRYFPAAKCLLVNIDDGESGCSVNLPS